MLRAKKIDRKKWLVLSAACVLLVAGIIIVFATPLPAKLIAAWSGRPEAEPPAAPPAQPDAPGPAEEPQPGPGETPEPGDDPGPGGEETPIPGDETEPEPEPDRQVPVIYAGQELIIPQASGIARGKSQVIREGLAEVADKQIALTFDAGWLYEQTEDLLAVLAEYDVKCTFFARARWVEAHPRLAEEIVRHGHVIENHSLTHGHLINMSAEEIVAEMRESTRLITRVTGRTPCLFRPPYGEYNETLLDIAGREGYPYTVLWTVDSHDWAEEIGGREVTTQYLIDRVLDNASHKGIILMHLGGYHTVEALPAIITGLREQGYTLVPVNEMLPPATGGITVTVKAGDTLYSLAKRFGVSVEQIISANNLS
ncbi:MAG: polysaccharide deacetylase family protein [Firmicutes bacterium]|nr:polysaccharide deacetylase family protein [Bacillota bacterium]